MLLLASRGGALGQRIGPRIPMTVGPLVMGLAPLLLLMVGPDVNYWRDVLPGLTVFGLGLALMVAPLTATVLAAAPDENAGIASGINNAVARAGSLLAVAALPVAVGLGGDDYADPAVFDSGVPLGHHDLRRPAGPRRHRLLVHHPRLAGGGRDRLVRRSSVRHLPWTGERGSAAGGGGGRPRRCSRPGWPPAATTTPAPVAPAPRRRRPPPPAGRASPRRTADPTAASGHAEERCATPTSWSSARTR